MNAIFTEKPNIIIVDDHLIFRQGLRSIITAEDIANVIGEASNGIEFINLLSHLKPDLVLMDIEMPHMNGLDATEKALEIMPDLKIIAFSMFSDEEYYYKMIDRGVKGFILKTSGINELENAIQNVMMGDSYFSNELLRKIINNYGRSANSKPTVHDNLTIREIEVLQQICLGLSTEEIAEKLFISPKTVKSHKSNLLEKTVCKNTPALILYAIKNKLVEI
ncbi:MAG: response regulator transcription factor [Bacteroidota bacterium]|nr:response regulator transcription factor [Bacteroidota bacterium]